MNLYDRVFVTIVIIPHVAPILIQSPHSYSVLILLKFVGLTAFTLTMTR